MNVTIQVVIERDDGPPVVDEIACLERATLTPDTLGLTLAEAKTVLAQLQNTLVAQQVATYVAQQQTCAHCGACRTRKGHHPIVMRSLFGKLTLSSPRLYACACQADDPRWSSSPLADLSFAGPLSVATLDPAAKLALAAMHVVAAGLSIGLLTTLAREKEGT